MEKGGKRGICRKSLAISGISGYNVAQPFLAVIICRWAGNSQKEKTIGTTF
ncbi:MAG: hypothetical protein J6A68_04450 [Oscillospiraceae bacterium]|nr:hypothetical protein [Oscillospiraceae bacterium]